MNKKIFTGLVSFIILVGAAFVYLSLSSSDDKAKDNMVSTTGRNQPEPTAGNGAESKPGTYLDYSEANLMDADGTRLLFFHAPWCSQCRQLEGDILDGGIPDGVTILKIDYDTNQALRQKYGVTLQTTFVKVNKSGDFIEKFVAYDEPTLASVIKNIL